MKKVWKHPRYKLTKEHKLWVDKMVANIKIPPALLDRWEDENTMKSLLWLVTGLTVTVGVIICIAGIIG